jgi:glycosyltransferase involved in cell wall biosynthesis
VIACSSYVSRPSNPPGLSDRRSSRTVGNRVRASKPTAQLVVVARRLLSALDLALAASLLLVTSLQLLVVRLSRPRPLHGPRQALMVLDAAYSLGQLERRRQLEVVTSRDLKGFFTHVWSVHPLVGASPQHQQDGTNGPPTELSLNDRHTVIEGHTSGSQELSRKLPALSLMTAQRQLVLRLVQVVQQGAVGLVQAEDPYYLGLLGMALKKARGIPLAVRVSGNYDAIYKAVGAPAYPRLLRRRGLEKAIERWVFANCDLVLAINGDNLRYALDNGADPTKSHVVPLTSSIPAVHFMAPSARPEAPLNAPLSGHHQVAMVSRLEPVKHVADIIAVMRYVSQEFPTSSAIVVGDGSQRLLLERQAESEGLDIRFVGDKDQEWIASVLPRVDVVVSPLTGRSLIEAALSGTPVVAYDTEWQSELVVDGVTGRLVPYRDTSAMAAAVVDLFRHPEVGAELGSRGRQKVIESMGPDVVLAKEKEVYGRLVAS